MTGSRRHHVYAPKGPAITTVHWLYLFNILEAQQLLFKVASKAYVSLAENNLGKSGG